MVTATKRTTIITAGGLHVFMNGKSYLVNKEHPNFSEAVKAARDKDWDRLTQYIDVSSSIEAWSNGEFTVKNRQIFYEGDPFSPEVSNKVFGMLGAGLDLDPLLNFLRKVRENPSASAQRELLLFAVANDFLIHEDGDIIAYKGVSNAFTDMHSGQINNSVGQVVTMPRHQVDDRREVTCSFGLHIGSLSQANGYGNRTVVVKVHPRDVVSIPRDYGNSKGRVCRYEVIAALGDRSSGLPRKEVYGSRDFQPGEATNVEAATKCSFCGEFGHVVDSCPDYYDEYDPDEDPLNDVEDEWDDEELGHQW